MIPIHIGVTGHRDVRKEDVVAVKEAIRIRLESLLKEYPNSDFVLFSGMAIGADSIFFDAARELNLDRIKIVAALPFDIAEYRKDFATPQMLDEFNKRLELASS